MANNWFPHDSSAQNDQRVLVLRKKYGWEGYGLYWAVLEAMYETADGKLDADVLRALNVRFTLTEEFFLEFMGYCVTIGLFVEEGGQVFSLRLCGEKQRAMEISERARKSSEIRWAKRSG